MDQEQERIQADLRGVLEGDVRCDAPFLQLYATDASIYEVRPLAVVRPQGLADVVACVQYAAEFDLPIHARGAGSGLAGESLGPGIVLDFSHAMRRIIETNQDTVRVQPGVVHEQLNRHLAKSGRLFGPTPATSRSSTMGGVLALDASGSHWPVYGSARDHVKSMRIVLADGAIMDVSQHDVEECRGSSSAESNIHFRRNELVRRLADVIQRNEQVIAEHRPKSLVNRSGYHLFDVLQNGRLDLARMLVGSEGTLALIVEATVGTSPLPKYYGAGLLFYERLESAALAAQEVRRLGASVCDLVDRRLLSIARESDHRFEQLLPPEAEAVLLVGQQGDDQEVVREQLCRIVDRLRRGKRRAFAARIALEQEDVALYHSLVRHLIPTLYRLKGVSRALPFVEDIALPPEKLPEFFVFLQDLLKKHHLTASVFAHAGHGQLHIRPFVELANPEHVRKMQDLAQSLYEEVIRVEGTISGEHGDGLSRTWCVRQMYGPLYDVFREVKRIFDAAGILNPGKVVADAPQPLTKNLRLLELPLPRENAGNSASPPAAEPASPLVELQLNWSNEELTLAARACNGCARCRATSPDERMCPIFRFAPAEEASPRAKANLMRAVMTGQLDANDLQTDALHDIAELCVNCHQCRLECPAGVDIPKLMMECKAQYVANNGLSMSDWFMTRLDLIAKWGGHFPIFANWAIRNRQVRWFLEKTMGLAQSRKLPKFAYRSFSRIAQTRRLTRPTRRAGSKVVYFTDLYANRHDPQLGEALVAVLEHNGVAVYVPTGQLESGMARISEGAVESARRVAAHNVAILAEAVRQGYHVITTEPSAALCLTHEYPILLDDDDVRLVAKNTSEATSYLWKMHQVGKLELDMKPVNAVIGYHRPCHLIALGVGSPGENLMRLTPGLTVRHLDRGCSGMAGSYGLKQKNFRSSLRAGWPLISAMRDPLIQVGATECSACKMQMEQGVSKPTIHPIKILALAYGLMPEIAELLTSRSEDLVVS